MILYYLVKSCHYEDYFVELDDGTKLLKLTTEHGFVVNFAAYVPCDFVNSVRGKLICLNIDGKDFFIQMRDFAIEHKYITIN